MRRPSLLVLLLLAAAPLFAGRNEAVVEQLPATLRRQADALAALSPDGLAAADRAAHAATLEARLQRLAAAGNLGLSARPLDAAGESPVHAQVRAEFERLAPHGLRFLGALRADTWLPVPAARAGDPTDSAATLTLDDRTVPLHPLWPNGPMPSLAPAGGISGRLVDAGAAEWEQLRGLPLLNSIALVEFSAGRRFERLFALGARAVIVLGAPDERGDQAEGLAMGTPLPYPRFYAAPDQVAGLRAAAAAGREARLQGGHRLAARPATSLFAYLPPTAPRRVTLAPDALWEFLARDYGSTGADLRAANPAVATPAPGAVLTLPGRRGTLTVEPGALWRRLAVLHATPLEALRAANPDVPDHPVGGFELVLPPVADPVVIVARLDAPSIVPGLTPGARTVANLAVTLATLDHLATSPAVVRRRGVLFAFIDGDTVGGLGARTLALEVLRARGDYPEPDAATRGPSAARYAAAAGFWRDGTLPDAATAQWLADEWLRTRHEDVRVRLAERRVALLGAKDRASLPAVEADLAFLASLRQRSLDRLGAAAPARLAAWRAALAEPATAARVATFGLDAPTLAARFTAEATAETESETRASGNAATARELLAVLGADSPRARLGLMFEFTGATGVIGPAQFPGDDLFRSQLRGFNAFQAVARRHRAMLATAAVNAGWDDPIVYATDDDLLAFPSVRASPAPPYDEFWSAAGVAVFPLSSRNDQGEHADTPADTLDRIDRTRLAREARQAITLATLAAESPPDGSTDQRRESLEFSRVTGLVAQFNLRSGIDAQDPVAGAYVFLPELPFDTKRSWLNSNSGNGYRRGLVVGTRLNGRFDSPLTTVPYSPRPRVYAYALDADRALFTRVATKGQVGAKMQVPEVTLNRGADTPATIVLSPLEPLVLFPGLDPVRYRSITGWYADRVTPRLLDAALDGPPREYAFDGAFLDFQERDVAGFTLYGPAGRRLRVISQTGSEFRMLLVGPVGADGRGAGYRIGGVDATGRPATFLPLTPLAIASDMTGLARHRLDLYGSFGIRDAALDDALRHAEERLATARAAADRADWQEAIGAARQAWGTLARNYPRILDLGREAVFSVILLMAALVPAAWFLERLLLGARGIVRQLVGVAAFLALGVLFLNYLHPAFRVALSPFIVVIAFTMILMSVVVLGLCYQRFDTVLRRARSAGGEVEAEEIGLAASLATAFSLGVANLRKRAGRTALTVFTVGVLAFAIVAFVSVTGRDALRRQPLALDPRVGTATVEPLPPAYEGLLLRRFAWQEINPDFVSAIQTEFGSRFAVAARAHYLEVEGGNQADREGVNQIPVTFGTRRSVQMGIVCFEPRETELSGLHRAVSGGEWFRPGEGRTVILPDHAAAALGLTAAQLRDASGSRRPLAELPEVQFSGHRWRVIGILDTALANRVRDANGRSLAIVDYLRSGMNRGTSGELENEGESYHLDWAGMIAIPLEHAGDVGARLRSVAIKLPPGPAGDAALADLAGRSSDAAFLHRGGETAVVVTKREVKLSGLARLAVPVLLCVLIVMNTMMGAVEERRGEVGMLGAIGLSPRQISFLLLSEATVYSLLAFVLGTFGGLAFANGLAAAQAAGWAVLPGLSFNFTSFLSMALATLTGGIVLLATLLPARRAAAQAAPSGMVDWALPAPGPDGALDFELPFTLTRANARGMLAFLHGYLARHAEPTSDDFNCRRVEVVRGADGAGELRTLLWLAPYDLDVSQDFALTLAPVGGGVCRATLHLRRLSGSEDAWLRTNRRFLDLIRHQFLLWRNLPPEQRDRFIAAADALPAAPVPASA
jgi:hypothetical protein